MNKMADNTPTTLPTPIGQRTAGLTDATYETEASIRELMSILDMTVECDVDSATVRYAVRGLAKLARSAYDQACEANRIADEVHESARAG